MYFILAVLAYGVALPGGLFVPAIEVGACYGRIIGRLLAVDIGLNTMRLVVSGVAVCII